MKTEPRFEKLKATSSWGALLGLVLLASGVSAILRLYGAMQDRPLLILYGVAAWKINWLFLSSAVLVLTNLAAVIFLWKRWRGFLVITWFAFAINLLSYWAERLFVWSVDQKQQGNLWFKIMIFGVYLVLMLVFTMDLKAKDRNEYARRN